jgi:hypothetical protein
MKKHIKKQLKMLVLIILAFTFSFSCSTEEIENTEMNNTELKYQETLKELQSQGINFKRGVKKRNEIVLTSTDNSGDVVAFLEGLTVDLNNLPNGNVRNWNWIVFPNDVTGGEYFRGRMVDENFNFLVIDDVSFGQYPTNQTNGYALAGSLSSGVLYYLRLERHAENGGEVVFVPILL